MPGTFQPALATRAQGPESFGPTPGQAAAVGLAGLFTCAVALLAGVIVESLGGKAIMPNPPLFAVVGVFFYAIAANIYYKYGWFCELMSRRLWPAETTAFGRLSFTFGLIGSVLLTLVPAVFVIVLSVIEMFAYHSTVH